MQAWFIAQVADAVSAPLVRLILYDPELLVYMTLLIFLWVVNFYLKSYLVWPASSLPTVMTVMTEISGK